MCQKNLIRKNSGNITCQLMLMFSVLLVCINVGCFSMWPDDGMFCEQAK